MNSSHLSLIFDGAPEKEKEVNKEMIRKISLGSLFLFINIFITACGNEEKVAVSLGEEVVLEQSSAEESTQTYKEEKIFVYITGQVKNPGVYQVEESARLYVVIEMAGGFTKKASKESLNLAQKVVDGQQIKVLSKAEYKKQNGAGTAVVGDAGESHNVDDGAGSVININTATAEELMTLPGIGETKAEAIINYRNENGNFSKIEDVMQVPGIKEGAFDKIKLLIGI